MIVEEHIIEQKVSFDKLGLTNKDIYQEMGYFEVEVNDEIERLTTELLDISSKICNPMFTYKMELGYVENGRICVKGDSFHPGRIITSLMTKAHLFAFFVATAGDEFQDFSNKLKTEKPLESFIIDAIGSCLVEKTGDYMSERIRQDIGELRSTNRFSPGYCDWDITEQKKLFSLFPQGVCGVTLNNSYLMYPIKSISGVIGIGESVKENIYSCDFCNKKNCYKNRKMDK